MAIDLALAFVLWRLMRALYAMTQKERAFLMGIGDGVVAIDRSWKIILWNAAAARMTGWNRDETMGAAVPRAHPPAAGARPQGEPAAHRGSHVLRRSAADGQQHASHRPGRPRDSHRPKRLPPLFDEDGKVRGVIVIFRDVTREKDAAVMRTGFAYASHQLHAPVDKALAGLELAMRKAGAETHAQLQAAHEAVRDVQKLADRLVEASQLDQKQVLPSYVETKVTAVVQAAIAQAKPEADARKVQVFLKPLRDDFSVETDPRLLAMALREVIGNAVLYNGTERAVDIMVQSEKDEAVFQVMGRSIGIPEEQKPLVFTKFFRRQNVPSDAHGAGLGLFVAAPA